MNLLAEREAWFLPHNSVARWCKPMFERRRAFRLNSCQALFAKLHRLDLDIIDLPTSAAGDACDQWHVK
jgi:hypothetical protein